MLEENMGKIGKKLFTELVMEKIKSKKISHTQLAERLGLTKYALSKVINGKQKMYLHEFLELSYAINLLHPTLTKSLEKEILSRMSYAEFEEIIRRKISGEYELDRAEAECEKALSKYKEKIRKYEEALSDIEVKQNVLEKTVKCNWKEIEEVICAFDVYARHIKKSDVPLRLYYLLASIINKFDESETSFDAASYIEYLDYKEHRYLEHNQLVLNFDDLND